MHFNKPEQLTTKIIQDIKTKDGNNFDSQCTYRKVEILSSQEMFYIYPTAYNLYLSS